MPLKKPYFNKASFWAKELRLPLFWLTDPRHSIFRDGVLVLYKNNVIRIYALDDMEKRAADHGYRFFSKPANVARYRKQAKEIISRMHKTLDAVESTKVRSLSDRELEQAMFGILRTLDAYSDVYTQTEPFVLAKIEDQEHRFRRLIRELGIIRFTLRKEGEPLFYTLLGIYLKEAARRFGLKASDLFFYTFDELQALFRENKVRNDVIEKRKKGYALICVKDKKTLLTGRNFKELYDQVVDTRTNRSILTGKTAMPGKARGKARIILHDRKNIARKVAAFRKGEILVTEMTRPDTVLACKKAAAIITDEGGITSHAAIISRELKIPCVIGTKYATDTIRTGQAVEVDADQGTVRILR